ncbi:pyridoxal phosphate-dependent aminotransferase [Tumebacillus sp. ITR2]|uniref:Pyridoxal phosphate-dependent aminotransferase n=1 Tax=Tumebacillus amylolyticus TaxID=2801339 RepID=A0ABS1JER7_9BACL|nr:pyridoxal phosphate-dependent aminotransferase [Tumebacillus amylolyticus]MBL0388752.1 pyridoxal phosphate-dependent aminotransferase [Tumebacillus amylolyticus]
MDLIQEKIDFIEKSKKILVDMLTHLQTPDQDPTSLWSKNECWAVIKSISQELGFPHPTFDERAEPDRWLTYVSYCLQQLDDFLARFNRLSEPAQFPVALNSTPSHSLVMNQSTSASPFASSQGLAVLFHLVEARLSESNPTQVRENSFFTLRDQLLCQSYLHLIGALPAAPLSEPALITQREYDDAYRFFLGSGPGRAVEQLMRRFEERFPYGVFCKKIYNHFFANDLYGKYDNDTENVILSSGSLDETEFPLSLALQQAINYALRQNWVGYSNTLGMAPTRKAVCDRENASLGRPVYAENNVAITMGGTSALYFLLQMLTAKLETRCEAVFVLPSYAPFMHACEEYCDVRYVTLQEDRGFKLRAEDVIAKVTSRTQLIVLVDVLNPTGGKLPKAELEILIDYAEEHNLVILLDEAGKCFLREPFEEPDNMESPNVVRVISLSKTHAVPGLKVGYILARTEIIQTFFNVASTSYGAPNSLFYLLLELQSRFEQYRTMSLTTLSESHLRQFNTTYNLSMPGLQLLYDEYNLNQTRFTERMAKLRQYTIDTLTPYMPDLIENIIVPDGSLNVTLKVRSELDSYQFFLRFLQQEKTAVFPGVCFGLFDGCWLRITFSISFDTLKEGLHRLIRFLKSEAVRREVRASRELSSLLIEEGRYELNPQINFYPHLYDVGVAAERLAASLSGPLAQTFNRQAMRLMVLLHDTGKVLSVYAHRISRVWNLSQRFPQGVPLEEMQPFRDDELLGLREMLQLGQPIAFSELLQLAPSLAPYVSEEELQSGLPLRDTILTTRILESAADRLKLDRADWALTLAVLNDEMGTEDVQFYRQFLDLADKIADDLPDKPIFSQEDVLEALELKKKYVFWRYGRDTLNTALVEQDFEAAMQMVRTHLHGQPTALISGGDLS